MLILFLGNTQSLLLGGEDLQQNKESLELAWEPGVRAARVRALPLPLTRGVCWEQARPFIKFPFPLWGRISPGFQ